MGKEGMATYAGPRMLVYMYVHMRMCACVGVWPGIDRTVLPVARVLGQEATLRACLSIPGPVLRVRWSGTMQDDARRCKTIVRWRL